MCGGGRFRLSLLICPQRRHYHYWLNGFTMLQDTFQKRTLLLDFNYFYHITETFLGMGFNIGNLRQPCIARTICRCPHEQFPNVPWMQNKWNLSSLFLVNKPFILKCEEFLAILLENHFLINLSELLEFLRSNYNSNMRGKGEVIHSALTKEICVY